jgi:hypothetical protein
MRAVFHFLDSITRHRSVVGYPDNDGGYRHYDEQPNDWAHTALPSEWIERSFIDDPAAVILHGNRRGGDGAGKRQ